jgi:protein-L-isoaspartate(D-aspartate) O-methyltransferase
VLSEIGVDVMALDSDPALLSVAAERGLNTAQGPLEAGLARDGPYDLILIDGAIEHIPEDLVDQLRDGGLIGYAAIDRGVTRLAVGRKAGTALGTRTIADSAVDPLPGFSRPRAFTF